MKCPHGYDHPNYVHSCDGCWCEGRRDREAQGWMHDTTPVPYWPKNVHARAEVWGLTQ